MGKPERRSCELTDKSGIKIGGYANELRLLRVICTQRSKYMTNGRLFMSIVFIAKRSEYYDWTTGICNKYTITEKFSE
jgi:hypothetical protein